MKAIQRTKLLRFNSQEYQNQQLQSSAAFSPQHQLQTSEVFNPQHQQQQASDVFNPQHQHQHQSMNRHISHIQHLQIPSVQKPKPSFHGLDLTKFSIKDFKLGSKLGKGKFGDVYIAKEKKTNFIVALKVLNKNTILQLGAQKLIVREIKIHSILSHPNIIKLFGVFHDEHSIYMILEYAPNGELYKELKKMPNKRYDEETASKYIKQVIDALKYLQDKDIIHRDLKPENLLKCFDSIKLADFGWSVHSPNKKLRKTFCGTLDYVPPEMVQGDRYDGHTDNWSLGILTYEFLTGSPPFEQRTKIDTLNSIVSSDIVIPDYMSSEACDFIKKLLLQNPKDRIELDQALQHPFIIKWNSRRGKN